MNQRPLSEMLTNRPRDRWGGVSNKRIPPENNKNWAKIVIATRKRRALAVSSPITNKALLKGDNVETYCVYAHTFPNKKIYVGITKQKPSRRWRKGKSYYSNPRLYRAFEKYGWDNIKHEILADGLTQQDAEQMERDLIKTLELQNPEKGYNLADGGIHPSHSTETKKKIGAKSKGRRQSEEFKRWISEKNSGDGNFMYGKHHTDEAKRKISEAKRGKGAKVNLGKFGSDHPAHKSIAGINERGDVVVVFGSIVEAAEKMNRTKSCLQAALHGKQKTCAGLKWVYHG